MKQSFLAVTLLSLATVTASCSFSGTPEPPVTGSGTMLSSTGSSAITATHNVSYIGTVSELGASVYMEGTHKLLLADGQFILLQSTDVNLSLSAYLGKHVEVRGSVQPTVEGNGEIMHVEEVTVLEIVASSETVSSLSSSAAAMCGGIAGIQCQAGYTCVDNPSDSCDPDTGGADCSGMCIKALTVSSSLNSSSVMSVPASSAQSSKAAVSSAATSVQSSVSLDAALEEQIVLLLKQKYADSTLWTQKYCTSHVAFCIPAHKNWYFKSFGATTNNLWHVEFGMSEIDALHSGPIVLNAVSGTVASMDAKDGQIKSQGSDIIGFADWTGGTHFELIADARLRDAVSYMLSHITPYSPGE